ncbi:MAG TPA: hypothetical protein VK146_01860, partial [Tabrizicola sp.]|nr:hypothetical protein [Tabrizicola sp.]
AVRRMTRDAGQADPEPVRKAIADYRLLPDTAVSADVTRAAEWADEHNIPRSQLYLGEFGALHTTEKGSLPPEWFHAFLSDKRKAAEDAGIPWAVLTYVGDMGIASGNDPERRLAPETCAALGLPCSK